MSKACSDQKLEEFMVCRPFLLGEMYDWRDYLAKQDRMAQPGTGNESEDDTSLQGASSGDETSPKELLAPGPEAPATAWPDPSSALPLEGSNDLRARNYSKSSSGRSTPTSVVERGDRAVSPPRDTTTTNTTPDGEASAQDGGAMQDEDSEDEGGNSQLFLDARESQGVVVGFRGGSLGARIAEFLKRGTERMADQARLYVTYLLLFMAAAGFLMCWMYTDEPIMLYSAAALFLVFCLVFLMIWWCLGLPSNM